MHSRRPANAARNVTTGARGAGRSSYLNVDGSQTFIKRMRPAPDVRSHQNVEAEILDPLLFDAVELTPLPVTPVFDVEFRIWLVTMPFVEQTGHVKGNCSHAYSEPLSTDLDTLARLGLVDVLIGSADRQPRNVLNSADGRVLPSDHDVAFLARDDGTRAIGLVGCVPGFCSIVASLTDNGYRRWLLSRCGALDQLLGSSPLYAPFRRRTQCDGWVRALQDAAAFAIDRIGGRSATATGTQHVVYDDTAVALALSDQPDGKRSISASLVPLRVCETGCRGPPFSRHQRTRTSLESNCS